MDAKASGDSMSNMLTDLIETNKVSSQESAEHLFESSRLKLMLEESEERVKRLSKDLVVRVDNLQEEFAVEREELITQIKVG